ncbi:hypothetical protein BS17DRAFT_882757 [Gyrodon lividus]|nr:hypothetical protein BS17DRAFT_882757 [Gyrodon lividus]
MADAWALIEGSITALHNNLRAFGLTYKMMQCTVSQQDEHAGQAWRDDIAANYAHNQFAIDESSKDGRTPIADLTDATSLTLGEQNAEAIQATIMHHNL